MLQRCSSTLPKRSIVNPCAAVHYVRSQEGPRDAELAFFEILKFSEIAANTGGQAAMVEDRLGLMSQLDFESITLSSGVHVQPRNPSWIGVQRQHTNCCFNRGASSNGRGPAGTYVPAGLRTYSEDFHLPFTEFAALIGGQAARWRTGRVLARSDFNPLEVKEDKKRNYIYKFAANYRGASSNRKPVSVSMTGFFYVSSFSSRSEVVYLCTLFLKFSSSSRNRCTFNRSVISFSYPKLPGS